MPARNTKMKYIKRDILPDTNNEIMKLFSKQKYENLKGLGEDLKVIFAWATQKVIVFEIST